MSKFKLLICDDDIRKVNQLRTVLGEEFEYTHVQNIEELERYYKSQNDYNAVFLDLVYGTEPQIVELDIVEISNVRANINPYAKLIIYTIHTIKYISLITDLAKVRLIDEWVDFKELTIGDLIECAKLRILNCIMYTDDLKDGLWFIHLSDLHFGRQLKINNEQIGECLSDFINEQIKENILESSHVKIKKPSMIIISGDITNSAALTDFISAKAFHNEMIDNLKRLGVNHPISIIAPGNHDFSWRLSLVEELTVVETDKAIEVRDEKTIDEYYKSLKWSPFVNTFNDLIKSDSKSDDKFSWWIYDYSERLGMNIFVYNSSNSFTYKSNNSNSLTVGLIKELEKNLKKIISKKLGMLVIHHPVALWGDDRLQKELLTYLYKILSVRIILSGHKHHGEIIKHRIDDDNHIIEVQTGSVSSTKDESGKYEAPNYRIIQLQYSHSSNIWEKLVSYTFAYQDGSYIIQPKNQQGKYYQEIIISPY